jgi:Cof subfamily protein (haloacid dehalogenase superfamily)
MKQKIKLVMSDIDGTILDDNHLVDTKLLSAIQQLKAKKIPFVLSSARSPKGMYDIAKELDILDFPIACYNGALILENAEYSTSKSIFSHELAYDEVLLLVDIIKTTFKAISINLYSGAEWYVDELDQWAKIESDITKIKPKIQNLQLLLMEKTLPIHKLLLIGTPQEIRALKEECEKFHLPTCAFYLSKENYLEVTNHDVSKDKALRDLADYYQIPLTATMAIGDNYNDVPMLMLAGIGVSMGNSPQEVIECSDVKTLSNNDHGASRAILNLIMEE